MKEDKEKGQSSSVKVYIRIRPLVGAEYGTKEIASVEEDNQTVDITTDSLSIMQTKFDHALNKNRTQKEVFDLFVPSICKIPQGFNMTVFAYGQTGSGKTYTMFGSDWESLISKNLNSKRQNTFFQDLASDENFAGLIPRTIYKLFDEVKQQEDDSPKFRIYCSFLQIYNEKIYDLLQDFKRPKPLNIHESKMDGIFVEGLAEYDITHYVDCLQLMKRGQKNRFIRQTSMNTKSSRSHTIFQILLESTEPDSKGIFKKARLNLCDLAGSQKVNKREEMGTDHFQELKNINQSLTTLGKVIYSLSAGKSIPVFRQSKLTRLLQDSLTANTFTYIIGNISPSASNTDETMNTLKFVERARHIVMKVKPMQFNGQNMEIVNQLQKQIQYLKELLNLKRKGMNPDDIHGKLLNLQVENEKLRRTSVSIMDVERLIQENRKMKMEIHKLQMTHYASSDFDSKSQRSRNSFHSDSKVMEELQSKIMKGSGFQLPAPQKGEDSPPRNDGSRRRSSGNTGNSTLTSSKQYSNTKSSLVRAGKSVINVETSPVQKAERRKEKQKILDKLEELERIQKFNEEKLMKDLEMLENKNRQTRKGVNVGIGTPLKKTPLNASSSSGRPVNYEEKIKDLQVRLFGS